MSYRPLSQKQPCPLFYNCPNTSDNNHVEQYYHSCKFGAQCRNQSNPVHMQRYVHNNQPHPNSGYYTTPVQTTYAPSSYSVPFQSAPTVVFADDDEELEPQDVPLCTENTDCKKKTCTNKHVCSLGATCKDKSSSHVKTHLHPCSDGENCKKQSDYAHIATYIHKCRYNMDCQHFKSFDIMHCARFYHEHQGGSNAFDTITQQVYNWPNTWQHSAPPTKLDLTLKQPHFNKVTLPTNSTEYTKVLKKFNSCGMNGTGTVVSIVRIDNYNLWKWYCMRRSVIEKNNGGNANELQLFHGCPYLVADVISNEGFDLRVAKFSGAWGSGIYFAPQSSTSNGYASGAPQSGTRHKTMFLSRVAVGAEFSSPGDSSLRKAPLRPNSHLHYDTSVAQQSKWAYIVYENNQAYPEYLITYK